MARGGKRPGAGRPKGDTFKPEYADQAVKLCRLGATDREIADFFGVAESTINKWKLDHSDFSESLKRGKLEADANVAERLYQRALGYTHDAVKIVTVAQGNNQGSEVQEVPYTEHYPPDTTAAIFWLKNRQPEKWRDKTQQELSGPGGSQLVPVVNVSLSKPRSGTAPEAGAGLSDKSE